MLPSLHFDRVAHIGHFPQRPGGAARLSYEGIGLSVSVYPDAWSQIARLSGEEMWLQRIDGQPGRFVDGYAVRKQAFAHGLKVGWLQSVPGWRVSYFDDDFDQDRFYETRDPEDAEGAREEGHQVDECTISIATGDLRARLQSYLGPDRDVEGATEGEVVNRYVHAVDASADGVWWQHELDPSVLSAPAGLILPERIADWRVVEIAS